MHRGSPASRHSCSFLLYRSPAAMRSIPVLLAIESAVCQLTDQRKTARHKHSTHLLRLYARAAQLRPCQRVFRVQITWCVGVRDKSTCVRRHRAPKWTPGRVFKLSGQMRRARHCLAREYRVELATAFRTGRMLTCSYSPKLAECVACDATDWGQVRAKRGRSRVPHSQLRARVAPPRPHPRCDMNIMVSQR